MRGLPDRDRCGTVRLLLVGVAIVALQASLVSTAMATETIPISPESLHEISLGQHVANITFGPEGGIWYIAGHDLERVTQDGFPTGDFAVKWGGYLGYPEEESDIFDLTAGSDGAMWFMNNGWQPQAAGLLGRVTTTGMVSEYLVHGSLGAVGGLAAGPAAVIWFTDIENGVGAIERISTKGAVETFPVPTGTAKDLPRESEPGPIVAGPDGNMWFIDGGSNDEGHNLMGRITAGGEITEYPLPGDFQFRQWLVAGPGGDVWVATSPNMLFRIAADGAITQFPMPRTGGEVDGLAAGPEGDLWYTSDDVFGETTLGRVTPSGETTLFEAPDGASWGEPVLGPDGEIWFVDGTNLVALKPPLAPAIVSVPSVQGEAIEGKALTASTGEWQNATSLALQWLLCDGTGGACEPLIGQSGHAMALLASHVGHSLRVSVTATGPGGSLTVTSAPSSVVLSAAVESHSWGGGVLAVTTRLAPTLDTTMHWRFGWSSRGTKIKSLRLEQLFARSATRSALPRQRVPVWPSADPPAVIDCVSRVQG